MIWSGWDGDLGLELYLTTPAFQDNTQQSASQSVMEFVERHGLKDRIEVHRLDELNGHASIFELINVSGYSVQLPFLMVGYGCETGAFLGYAGLEAVTAQLTGLLLKDMPKPPNQQY